jgi:hypothetical protein
LGDQALDAILSMAREKFGAFLESHFGNTESWRVIILPAA